MNPRKSEPVHARDLTVTNKRGLHARAAAKFVQTVERFNVAVVVSKDGHSVGGDSIMGLMMLAAAEGSEIHVEASGPEAETALALIERLVESRFDEDE